MQKKLFESSITAKKNLLWISYLKLFPKVYSTIYSLIKTFESIEYYCALNHHKIMHLISYLLKYIHKLIVRHSLKKKKKYYKSKDEKWSMSKAFACYWPDWNIHWNEKAAKKRFTIFYSLVKYIKSRDVSCQAA